MSGKEKSERAGQGSQLGAGTQLLELRRGKQNPAACIVCPEKKGQFSNISLSANTVAERISDLSIALDETQDITDTAQTRSLCPRVLMTLLKPHAVVDDEVHGAVHQAQMSDNSPQYQDSVIVTSAKGQIADEERGCLNDDYRRQAEDK
ncbi:hypothetical protein C0Q70_13548 [Pomacea canaliculata]|uniref:Uncharacterized protein n=1 Tax=Pomacea canaliculata TaxID=400727 RepID=A0A2T7NXK0_POMCA|nr:hypothetical protein C0Q70_13548 [Pomacea canaliculata]